MLNRRYFAALLILALPPSAATASCPVNMSANLVCHAQLYCCPSSTTWQDGFCDEIIGRLGCVPLPFEGPISCGAVGSNQVYYSARDRVVQLFGPSGDLRLSEPVELRSMRDTSRDEGAIWRGLRCGDDIQVGSDHVSVSYGDYLVVRHGRQLDLLLLIGITDSGRPISIHARLQDGSHHGVIHTPRGPLIRLGRNKDVNIQYCFDGKSWTSSVVVRHGERTDYPCGPGYIRFFNGGAVQYSAEGPPISPPRPPATQIPYRGDLMHCVGGYCTVP